MKHNTHQLYIKYTLSTEIYDKEKSSLCSSLLLHLGLGPLGLVTHSSTFQLPNQGQNLPCRFITTGPVN